MNKHEIIFEFFELNLFNFELSKKVTIKHFFEIQNVLYTEYFKNSNDFLTLSVFYIFNFFLFCLIILIFCIFVDNISLICLFNKKNFLDIIQAINFLNFTFLKIKIINFYKKIYYFFKYIFFF